MRAKPRCRSCDQEVTWVVTEAGRFMPLDPIPTAVGNVVLVDGPGGSKVARVVDSLGDGVEPRWRSHFATCPQAKRWRRPRGVRAFL